MAKTEEKLRAESLRRLGWSMKEIAKELDVSKSSISNWCRDIELSAKQKRLLLRRMIEGGHRGRLLGSATNHNRKLERINNHIKDGKVNVGSLSNRELLLVGAAIYWGEGSKKSQLAFINSDKDMILFMYRWFRSIFGINKESFILRIYINELHRGRRNIIEKYWSDLLKIPVSQFRKTIFIKRVNTKRYSNHDTYFGLLSIRTRNSTDLKYRILGLIEGLKHSKFR